MENTDQPPITNAPISSKNKKDEGDQKKLEEVVIRGAEHRKPKLRKPIEYKHKALVEVTNKMEIAIDRKRGIKHVIDDDKGNTKN